MNYLPIDSSKQRVTIRQNTGKSDEDSPADALVQRRGNLATKWPHHVHQLDDDLKTPSTKELTVLRLLMHLILRSLFIYI